MENPEKEKMSRERIEALRERLYAREGGKAVSRERSPLQDIKRDVPREWQRSKDVSATPAAPTVPPPTAAPSAIHDTMTAPPAVKPVYEPVSVVPAKPNIKEDVYSKYVPYKNPSRKYRIRILIGGVIFFVLAILLSSAFLLWGNKSISGDNITIGLSGPFAVGGGEEVPLQIAISNQNAVPIESATLIIEYPNGTQSAEVPGKELFQDRKQLESIAPGEVLNISTKAIIFGEENAERIIKVSVEYRVRGSNAVFVKESAPLRLKISSSPAVLLIDSVTSITTGQETEIKLTIGSNSPTPLTDVLVKAEYPFGFDYSTAEPRPDSGKDTWLIKELKPEEKETITIKGIVTGKQDEERTFNFSVGVPNERDKFTLSSVFTTGSANMKIEDPFLGVGVEINGKKSDTVVVQNSQDANVRITFKNTLEDTIYDGKIEVVLEGSALNEVDIEVEDGFYDSKTNTVTWDAVSQKSLSEIAPGSSSAVSFTMRPRQDIRSTPEIKLNVTTKGQRVFENRVPQELVSTATRTVKVESLVSLSSFVTYSEDQFENSGPVPPVAEKETEYTLQLSLKNGSNGVTDAEVSAVLPQYVKWLGNVSSGDTVSYEATTRTVTWRIGELDSNETAKASVQVGFTPSLSQVDKVPTLIETQRVKATDRFTGTTIRGESAALTTALSQDSGVSDKSGKVRASE